MKLGSLFDGSGGFPLAGSLCGIEPVWASEVEPYPIAVTKSRFPNMKHLGSVTEVHGGDIEPVDIITFGSPCQDLSVAGKRAGLKHEANGDEETTRSGLFMEAVRIIKEMRKATNGEYPTFAVWENVPGAFSSNKGEDFRTVLEELIKIVEPTAVMPAVPENGWPYADSYCGDGWSLAYRVFDAQYWGVPQRRRRIYLVLDLRGKRAGKVSFEREGLRWNFATFKTAGQGAAGYAADRTGADDCEGAIPYTLKIRSGCDGGGKGSLIQENKSATLATNNDQYLFQPIAFAQNQRDEVRDLKDKAGALAAEPGMKQQTFVAVPCNLILDDQGGQQITVRTDGKVPTLRAETHGNLPAVMEPVTIEPGIAAREGGHIYEGVCGTLRANAGDNQMAVAYAAGFNYLQGSKARTIGFEMEKAGTLRAGQFGDAVLVKMEVESPVYCLQGNGIDRADTAGCNGKGWKEDTSYTLNTIVRRITPTECARLQGFLDRWGDIDQKEDFTEEEYRFWCDVVLTKSLVDGTVAYNEDGELYFVKQLKPYKQKTKEQMLNWYNKLHTDSSEYKMWGNGISLPTALYVMQGIAEALKGGDGRRWKG